MDVHKALQDYFNLTTFRQGQKEIINDLLNGHDVLAMLPTGAGKSLCYQLPAFMLKGITVVVSPLLSLMEDQVQQLKSKGFKNVVAINSFLTKEEREIAIRQLQNQKIIYVSPEILQSKFVMKKLKSLHISLFVVDEAHCISQWGHEFRTDYLKLHEARLQLNNPPCLAITATATKEVQKDITEKLAFKKHRTHIYSIDRPNIAMVVQNGAETIQEKISELTFLVENLQGPGIIYASTRKWTEDLTRILQNKGIKKISAYHGGMSNEDRLLIQQQFLKDELQLICCTSAFGMGVNKQNIRYVIHFHFPLQLESYLQEIGRAGRDGKESVAITLYSEEETALQLSLITREFPSEEQVREVLAFLHDRTDEGKINETKLIYETGITEIMWRFIRYHLEAQGVIVEHNYIPELANETDLISSITKIVTNRIEYKQKKLTAFQKWLRVRSCCRRELVLQQFNENLINKPNHCCDICGINIENYFTTENSCQEYQFHSWQKELQRIFHY